MHGRAPVTFMPSGATVWVELGLTVLEASRRTDVPISSPCGGRATCGACGVRVLQGALAEADAEEAAALAKASSGVRLACRARVTGPVSVQPLIRLHPTAEAAPASLDQGTLVAGIDLGTTTVAVIVASSLTGSEVGRATVPNLQAAFGADVVSRISSALDGESTRLAQAAERSILNALEAAAGSAVSQIERVVIAGNSAMMALLTGADVTSLAAAPFEAPDIPSVADLTIVRAGIAPDAEVRIVPTIGAFVGGDVVAGLVGLNATSSDGPAMLVDIGTNAEVALWDRGRLTVASAPAGPAFEAVGISSGGPATTGAVVRVKTGADDTMRLWAIGNSAPSWFSGAGLVSALAVLRSSGHLTAEGRLVEDGPHARRVARDSAGVLVFDFGDDAQPLTLTQLDIRSLQLAKAAVRVAVEGVLREAGVGAASLTRVWVGGAFGGALSEGDLVTLGFVPVAVSDVIVAPGNTSVVGAAALALDPARFDEAALLMKDSRVVDLPAGPDFPQALMAATELAPFGG